MWGALLNGKISPQNPFWNHRKSKGPPTERRPLDRCEFKRLYRADYVAFRKIMTNVNSTSDSMKAKLRIMAI